ncbi:hypothetical protein BLNAU_851 [Blattamonas nauphoetae]|uniref:Uncharacterized protein n=1 Tax=Blattamonas nauphoetae TaxID=2049346 RepID=A0ABQ9YKP3_9EUKA|nr:hypothetical protein BLNAU_851 [Blattamonas nauphoetae]
MPPKEKQQQNLQEEPQSQFNSLDIEEYTYCTLTTIIITLLVGAVLLFSALALTYTLFFRQDHLEYPIGVLTKAKVSVVESVDSPSEIDDTILLNKWWRLNKVGLESVQAEKKKTKKGKKGKKGKRRSVSFPNDIESSMRTIDDNTQVIDSYVSY